MNRGHSDSRWDDAFGDNLTRHRHRGRGADVPWSATKSLSGPPLVFLSSFTPCIRADSSNLWHGLINMEFMLKRSIFSHLGCLNLLGVVDSASLFSCSRFIFRGQVAPQRASNGFTQSSPTLLTLAGYTTYGWHQYLSFNRSSQPTPTLLTTSASP
jgi:hypothetical protein